MFFNILRLQAKIVYGVPFSEDEKQSIKHVIQGNVYRYIGILLEGRAHFEEDYLVEMRRQQADEPSVSGMHTKFHINIMLKYARILYLHPHKKFKYLMPQKMLLFIPLKKFYRMAFR